MSKYRLPVVIETTASHVVGFVECDSVEEFNKKSYDLWESKDFDYPSANISNDFDLCDWDIAEIGEDDLKYHLIK